MLCGDCTVIPLRQEIIKNSAHIIFEISGIFSSGFESLINNVHENFESRFGMIFLHQFFDQLNRSKYHTLACSGYVREKAIFDGVPF